MSEGDISEIQAKKRGSISSCTNKCQKNLSCRCEVSKVCPPPKARDVSAPRATKKKAFLLNPCNPTCDPSDRVVSPLHSVALVRT